MTALAGDVAAELQAEYPRAEVSVEELPHALGDLSMLGQVWVNLIGNALKYSANTGQPRITFGGAEVNGEAAFAVRDNGAGFDMKHAGRLFEVFQRLHSEKEFRVPAPAWPSSSAS
jgi:light-regulated signal transduction histidine kinase (bacteriophytochrome)